MEFSMSENMSEIEYAPIVYHKGERENYQTQQLLGRSIVGVVRGQKNDALDTRK